MHRENCKRLLEDGILQAFAEGKPIQYRLPGCNWCDGIDNLSFHNDTEYRLRPEPTYRPYTPQEAATILFGKEVSYCGVLYKVYLINLDGQIVLTKGTKESGLNDYSSYQETLGCLCNSPNYSFFGQRCGVLVSEGK